MTTIKRCMRFWRGNCVPPLLVQLSAVVLAACLWFLASSHVTAQPAIPEGVWLMDGRVAVQTFDCGGLMCGRVVWMVVPRNPQGQLMRDAHNPNPLLRQRQLCGLTIIWNLRPAGVNRWRSGWFYNPDDGRTYRVSARFMSDDAILARIYLGLPIFGENRTFARVPHGTSAGWC
jgi:uncharacterized protein (DUF2147 family)